jgi:amino acid transporter/nucleotide-binding universal stress UspA family protein
MLATHQDRPRELRWFHAGPMLYGDWGTSRFYVLGLAFYYALHASFFYVLGVCALVAAVGWAYTIICRCYPDGGGVYSAAKHTSRVLAVVGALLLFADYIITASLSALDGMHYLGIPDQWVPVCAISAIALVGIINYIGPKKAGTFAPIVALATLALTIVLFLFAIPHVAEGWRNIHRPTEPLGHQWLMLVNVVLALSGVEAIANMTGIMVQPVEKTSKKAIWPVLLEVVIFNLIFAVAMNALPSVPGVQVGGEPAYQKDARRDEAATLVERQKKEHVSLSLQQTAPVTADEAAPDAPQYHPTPDEEKIKNAVLRFMGEKFVGKWFCAIAGVVFGMLLLSAVNTAVADMICIQYVMSRDAELPRWFTKLNMFGVPWIALLPAVLLPVTILCFVTDLEKLADLYAIGVVGAIGINLGSCTINKTMPLTWWERAGMGVLALIMAAIEGTLAYQKPHALYFAGSVLILGLAMRFVTKTFPAMRQKARKQVGVSRYRGIEVPAEAAPAEVESLAPDMSRPTILVATRGGQPLLEFAVDYARDINANLFVLYVRRINIAGGPVADLTLEDDPEAQRVLRAAQELCRKQGVRVMPIYVVSSDVAYSILDFAATYNVKALLMGVSRKATLLRALQGDVLTEVAEQLPNTIPLLIHA